MLYNICVRISLKGEKQMYIDDTEAKLLLETNRDNIGCSNRENIEMLISGIMFIVSNVFADYNIKHIPDIAIKIICAIVGGYSVLRGGYLLMNNIKSNYNHHDLYNDLKKLDKITHPFSIVAIKDTFNKYPNRFLLYYDARWDCDFFFSFRTVDNNNTENIIKKLSAELQLDEQYIKVDYKTQEIQSKFSESDKIQKTYEHKLYCAEISHFSKQHKQDSFEINGKKFKWMTIEQMEQDENIKKKNLDVVDLVKIYS